MVRRRSTVRFRNGAPAQRVISNAGSQDQETRFQDQETSDALQPWLTVSTARRTRTQVAFWPAGTDRSRSLPVSVAWRIASVSWCGQPAVPTKRSIMTGGPAIRLCAEIEVRPLGEQNGARGNLFGHHDRYLACEARRRQSPCRGSSAADRSASAWPRSSVPVLPGAVGTACHVTM